MNNFVYRNYDRYSIKNLLKEIGAHTMQQECERKRLGLPKRLSAFFIEANEHCTFLKYKYPLGHTSAIMKLDQYELPEKGWERYKID